MNWLLVIFLLLAAVLLILLGLSLGKAAHHGDDRMKKAMAELDSCKLKDPPDLQETKGQKDEVASKLP